MQATLEIATFIIVTAAMLWWVYKGFSGEAPLADKLGMVGVKIFFWIIAVFLALSLISADQPISVPVLPLLATYVGAVASFGFVVAGSMANKIRNMKVGQDLRLSGIPMEPNLLWPWIPAVLTGFITVIIAAIVSGLWYVVLMQQEVLQGIQRGLSTGTGSSSFGFGPDTTMITWLAGGIIIIVLVAYGIQWLRYRRAWRHYRELSIGITNRVNVAVDAAIRDTDIA